METSFRPAEPSDADALVEMMRGLYEHDRSPFDESAHRAALALLFESDAHALAYLLLSGAEVAGYVVITFGFSLEFRGRDAFIDELFVKDEFRGRGLGGEAIRFAEGVCRERGVRALHLEVDRENARAQSVYRRAGFVDHKNYLMTKWLS
ncbi:MAG TPA: GNAT family N-acetyltransferase [Pyrinomonadaceae bacterium]|nr:GNAT family N-acetyltransferase [Pyrinomonadaceae bacterium]